MQQSSMPYRPPSKALSYQASLRGSSAPDLFAISPADDVVPKWAKQAGEPIKWSHRASLLLLVSGSLSLWAAGALVLKLLT